MPAVPPAHVKRSRSNSYRFSVSSTAGYRSWNAGWSSQWSVARYPSSNPARPRMWAPASMLPRTTPRTASRRSAATMSVVAKCSASTFAHTTSVPRPSVRSIPPCTPTGMPPVSGHGWPSADRTTYPIFSDRYRLETRSASMAAANAIEANPGTSRNPIGVGSRTLGRGLGVMPKR